MELKRKIAMILTAVMLLIPCQVRAAELKVNWQTRFSSMKSVDTLFAKNEYEEAKTLYTTTYLNKRDFPNIKTGNVVKVLKPNAEITAISDFNGWTKIIELNDKTGEYEYFYVWNKYLSEENQVIKKATTNNSYSNKEYLGNFKLTAYCKCSKCCGKWANGYTASGTVATAGRTVAMSGVPFGTKLLINGHVYTVEDRGTPYGHVDIYHYSHSDALNFGRKYADVYRAN